MKSLVVCFDGTWNQLPDGREPGVGAATNVARFFHALAPADARGRLQRARYFKGVGTDWYNERIGGAFGLGLSSTIRDAYRFLVENYAPGDRIFIIGFSRGAYSARSLVGMIRNVGLMRRAHVGRILAAYMLYRRRDDGPDTMAARRFRERYSREVQVEMLGVFDTVGALGIPLDSLALLDGDAFAFHDTRLSGIVRHAYHALAVDEHREIFEPTMWTPREPHGGTLEQAWFAGAHADVGGGYSAARASLEALFWMQEKARALGLAFLPGKIARPQRTVPPAQIHDSFSSFLGGHYARFRKRIVRPVGTIPHGGETIHESVLARLATDPAYDPANPTGAALAGIGGKAPQRLRARFEAGAGHG